MKSDGGRAAADATSGLPSAGLPLTAFEEHMLADDRPTHPMVIAVRLDFAGGPPPPSLAAAFTSTLRQEPLLTARVQRRRLGRPRWMAGEPPRLLVSSAGEVAGDDAWPGVPPRIDAYDGPVLHAEVLTRADGWTLLIAVHHAAADGLGIVGFIERWLDAAAGRDESPRRRPRPVSLAARGRVAASWGAFMRMLPGLALGLQGVRQFMARRVMSLERRAVEAATAPAGHWRPAVVTATLDVADVQAIDRQGRAAAGTVNDILMAAFVATLGEWHAAEPARDEEAWIRVGVPMSLRTKSDYGLPAANRVSMVFLDRRAADRHDPDGLVRGLHAEMDVIRVHGLGHVFPLTLELGRLLPGGLRRVAERPAPQCTAVLSNLGRCFHRSPLTGEDGQVTLGAARLVDWWIVPPVRPGTAIAAATHETGGRRTIALHVAPSGPSAADARRLLEEWTRGVRGLGVNG
jgi:hypothetical protein